MWSTTDYIPGQLRIDSPVSFMGVTVKSNVPEQVLVHPLVLLSVVDHYKRAELVPGKRVLGVLLGYWTGKVINVTNSYALPFEENEHDPSVWYVDHNYHENMRELYKKINAKERTVGWYHSGPKLRSSDLIINELFSKYCPTPVLCVIDPHCQDGPVHTYVAIDELREDGTTAARSFAHVTSGIEAEEAEEVGVEHLLRDLRDGAISRLQTDIASKTHSLTVLDRQLGELDAYLEAVMQKKLPVNQGIIAAAQNMFNLLPDVHSASSQLALTIKTNDQLAMIYVGALTRAAISLNDLINNKMDAAAWEEPASGRADAKAEQTAA